MRPTYAEADIPTTSALRQAGAVQESFISFTSVRAVTSGAGALTVGARASKPGSAGVNDLYLESDTGWLFYFTGTVWQFAGGVNSGTDATRAAITVTANDNGATFITSDTRSAWQVVAGVWVLRLSGVGLNKYDATTAPTVTDDAAIGYSVGSVYINVTLDDAYICVDSTATAAVWKKTTV